MARSSRASTRSATGSTAFCRIRARGSRKASRADRDLFCGDRAAQGQRRSDAIPRLGAAQVIRIVLRTPCPDYTDRAVVEYSSPESLIDVDRCHLVHVGLDRMTPNEAALEDDTTV